MSRLRSVNLETLRQSLWPRHLLAALTHGLVESERPWLKRVLINHFLSGHTPDMHEAELEDPYAYTSFNHFFSRRLKPGMRPLAAGADALLAPVDGWISACGPLDDTTLLQAKGRHYTLQALLASAWPQNSHLRNGSYLCCYLAPEDYHRVHMPLDAQLLRTTYVPGRLFSLDARAVRHVDQLYARNERLVCEFDSSCGRFVLVLVGAGFVSGIVTAWDGPMPRGTAHIISRDHTSHALHFAKGAELAHFRMGSTVLVLLPPGCVQWNPALVPGQRLRMGTALGRAQTPES